MTSGAAARAGETGGAEAVDDELQEQRLVRLGDRHGERENECQGDAARVRPREEADATDGERELRTYGQAASSRKWARRCIARPLGNPAVAFRGGSLPVKWVTAIPIRESRTHRRVPSPLSPARLSG